jgi:hypothetical protein
MGGNRSYKYMVKFVKIHYFLKSLFVLFVTVMMKLTAMIKLIVSKCDAILRGSAMLFQVVLR